MMDINVYFQKILSQPVLKNSLVVSIPHLTFSEYYTAPFAIFKVFTCCCSILSQNEAAAIIMTGYRCRGCKEPYAYFAEDMQS